MIEYFVGPPPGCPVYHFEFYISFISFLFSARPTSSLFNYEITVSFQNNRRLWTFIMRSNNL